jgi:hypothetical protein
MLTTDVGLVEPALPGGSGLGSLARQSSTNAQTLKTAAPVRDLVLDNRAPTPKH